MEKMDKNKSGLTFGFLISFIHLVWSLTVAFGFAQAMLNFIFKLHMLEIPITVMPFSFVYAIGLIIVTFIVGYVFGWFMAYFWNKCFR